MSLETMTKLATYTVGSGGESSITFSNIPQSYTDLKILLSVRASSASGNSNCFIYLNGVTGTSYAQKRLSGNGSTVTSDTQSSYPWIDMIDAIPNATYTTSTFGNAEIYIPNYTSNSYKPISIDFVGENNASTSYQYLDAGLFSSTNPITSLTIDGTDNFVQYSTATLYGVKSMRAAVGNSIKATGGAIAFDGTYVTHTFNTTDTFIPTQPILVDYLVVAGGGGGGSKYYAGGGGAGGLRCTVGATGGGGTVESRLSLTAQSYTVTIGAGGAAGTYPGRGASGSDSVFSTITSTGGGGGATGDESILPGANGGSGGGGSAGLAASRVAGTGTANQGFAGGNGSSGQSGGAAGGGGGAGAVGSTASSITAGAGGAGVATSITGPSVTYAGGGGGSSYSGTAGAGGSGGGGAGAKGEGSVTQSVAGTTNLGGGGGGGSHNSTAGAAGGSGVVVIRYKA